MALDVDDTDRLLLTLLKADGRLPVRELARLAHISRANAYTRVNRMREIGAIRGFVADVHPEALGLELAAYVYVRLQQRSWKEFTEAARTLPEVQHIALVSGDYDCVLLVRTQDVHHLRDVVLESLQALPHVLATQTVFILDEVEPERPTAVPQP